MKTERTQGSCSERTPQVVDTQRSNSMGSLSIDHLFCSATLLLLVFKCWLTFCFCWHSPVSLQPFVPFSLAVRTSALLRLREVVNAASNYHVECLCKNSQENRREISWPDRAFFCANLNHCCISMRTDTLCRPSFDGHKQRVFRRCGFVCGTPNDVCGPLCNCTRRTWRVFRRCGCVRDSVCGIFVWWCTGNFCNERRLLSWIFWTQLSWLFWKRRRERGRLIWICVCCYWWWWLLWTLSGLKRPGLVDKPCRVSELKLVLLD